MTWPAFPLRFAAVGFSLALLNACTLGPDYQRPLMPEATEFRQAKGWKPANPSDLLRNEAWWKLYKDPVLNRLVERLNTANQNIAVAEAQYRQAQALVSAAWAQRLPTVTSSAQYTRSERGSGGGSSGGGSFNQSGSNYSSSNNGSTSNSGSSSSGGSSTITDRYNFGLNISWDADLWGKLRRNQESQQALSEAGIASWAAVRLAQQASLVQTYMQLRVLDAQQRLLDRTVEAYRRSLRLTQNQYEAGIVAKVDVTQAVTQLKNTEAQATDLHWQRAQYEHAIAVLAGVAPSELQLTEVSTVPQVPDVPLGVPSQLLERRPDVAAAERQVISANAEIGVAEAAWFPDLTLTANGGFSNTSMGHLFTVPNRYWSLGPQFNLTLLDFGARRAELARVQAAYDEQVATYRQTVLDSFREVEDYLSQVHILGQEMQVQALAVEAAQDSLQRMENQYKAGMIDYLSVVNLQTTALSTERSLLTLHSNRLTASVQLIAALGGGWNESLNPPPKMPPFKKEITSTNPPEPPSNAPKPGVVEETKEKVEKVLKKFLTWFQ